MGDNYAARFAAKWPEDVAQRGFAPVPKCIVTCAGDLGLKPLEVLVLCNVVEKCWKKGERAFFGVEYIATNIGRGKSTVIETTNSLVKKGFITKTPRFNKTNLYSLEPCQARLDEHLQCCRRWGKSRNLEEYVQKAGATNIQKTDTYIEAEIIRTNELDPFYSHIVNNNNDDMMHIVEEYDASPKANREDSDDYKDYIEPFIFGTPEEEALISQFTKETEKRISFLEWVENAKDSYPCFLEVDEDIDDYEDPHIWETYEGEGSVNQFGEELIWKFWHCTRCNEMFHRQISIDVLNKYEYKLHDMPVIV